jgi:hypothetical protein
MAPPPSALSPRRAEYREFRVRNTTPSDIDGDPPLSHAITDGWEEFAERVLPSIHGTERAQAHAAFHFGGMYVLQLTQQMIADSSSDALSVALDMLDAEIEQFMSSHAVAIQ